MPQPPKPGPRKYLRRYTHLPAAIHLLKTRTLTLLDPSGWDDGNDVFYMEEFKRRKGLKSLLAVCLSGAEESYHYWKVFAGNPAGVCIRLRQGMLLRSLRDVSGATFGEMDYRLMTAARKKELSLDDFPFVKRHAYIDEQEVRIIWQSESEARNSFNIQVPLGCVARITLSPWLPKSLVETTRAMLREVAGQPYPEVVRSTIVASEEWKNIARHAA